MFEAPFFKTLGTILISFRMGQGGVAVFVLALMTALLHWLGESHKWSRFMAVVSAGGLAFAVGYTSHAASLTAEWLFGRQLSFSFCRIMVGGFAGGGLFCHL